MFRVQPTAVDKLNDDKPQLHRRAMHDLSIRGKVLAAFLALSTITALVGGVAYTSLDQSSHLVTQVYDKPLTGISFARQILADFTRLESAFTRAMMARTGKERAAYKTAHDLRLGELLADIDVVEQRSTSDRARHAAHQVRLAVQDWLAVADVALRGLGQPDWARLDSRSAVVNEEIDLLVNYAAGDGFLARQQALTAVRSYTAFQFSATLVALGASIIIALLLLRRILGPVAAASYAARRIAGGELDVAIPSMGRDELGTLLDSMSSMRDTIRSRVEEEQSLRRLAQVRLAEAIESSSEGVAVVDHDGRIVVANSQVARILARGTASVAAGSLFHTAVLDAVDNGAFAATSEDDRRRLVARLESTGADAIEEELVDGRWMHISRNLTGDGGMIAIFSDITLQKEREAVLREAKEKAEAGNRTKSEFLATMSHELRTPLNAVIGFSEFIAAETLGPIGQPKYREFIDDIHGSAKRLLAIINDILEWSKLDAGHVELDLQEISFGSLHERLLDDNAEVFAKAGVTLVVDPCEGVAVKADRSKLLLVLNNLLSNAAKFTPPGGQARLEARPGPDGRVQIRVTDTGIGMKADDIPKALQPFGQVDSRLARKYEGTGLGLTLVKALVERHGGALSIDSSPGTGTTVTISLEAAARSGLSGSHVAA